MKFLRIELKVVVDDALKLEFGIPENVRSSPINSLICKQSIELKLSRIIVLQLQQQLRDTQLSGSGCLLGRE